jgi:hypothetical protein
MTSSTLSSRLLFVAAVAALPFTGGGCGREACFTWSALEGTCPSQSEALSFFSNPECPGKVTSVESEATSEMNGTLCCYQVTAREESDEAACQGFGGASSTGSGGPDGGESSAFAVSSSTVSGGGGSCSHCGDVFGLQQPKPICPESELLFKAFADCACSGACAKDCADNFCASVETSPTCFTCLEAKEGCMMDFSTCANDI